jgi:RNA polymerase sigma-70 factor (ECF subfamily)
MGQKARQASVSADLLQAELRPLYAFVYSRTGNSHALAEDLTQDTILAALQGSFDPARGPLRSWLFGIAIRKISDGERRRRTAKTHLLDAARDLAVRMIREPLLDDWVQREEVRSIVNDALGRLPVSMAHLLIRKYFESASVAELSSELAMSPKAVESQLTRARTALHEAIERFGQDEWRSPHDG